MIRPVAPPPGVAVAVEVVALVCLTLLCALGKLPSEAVVALATLTATGYALSRQRPTDAAPAPALVEAGDERDDDDEPPPTSERRGVRRLPPPPKSRRGGPLRLALQTLALVLVGTGLGRVIAGARGA